MGKWAKYARNYKKEWEKEPDVKGNIFSILGTNCVRMLLYVI